MKKNKKKSATVAFKVYVPNRKKLAKHALKYLGQLIVAEAMRIEDEESQKADGLYERSKNLDQASVQGLIRRIMESVPPVGSPHHYQAGAAASKTTRKRSGKGKK